MYIREICAPVLLIGCLCTYIYLYLVTAISVYFLSNSGINKQSVSVNLRLRNRWYQITCHVISASVRIPTEDPTLLLFLVYPHSIQVRSLTVCFTITVPIVPSLSNHPELSFGATSTVYIIINFLLSNFCNILNWERYSSVELLLVFFIPLQRL